MRIMQNCYKESCLFHFSIIPYYAFYNSSSVVQNADLPTQSQSDTSNNAQQYPQRVRHTIYKDTRDEGV